RLQGGGAAVDLMGCIRVTHGMEVEADQSPRILSCCKTNSRSAVTTAVQQVVRISTAKRAVVSDRAHFRIVGNPSLSGLGKACSLTDNEHCARKLCCSL